MQEGLLMNSAHFLGAHAAVAVQQAIADVLNPVAQQEILVGKVFLS